MIRLIAAMDRRRGIAKQGFRPWLLPADMRYFADMTKRFGGNILVGGTTFRDDLKSSPLADRTTYVVSRRTKPSDGVQIIHDMHSWLENISLADVWVIGGASIYRQVIDADQADELYITHIDEDFDCDLFFPDFHISFRLLSQTDPIEQNGIRFSHAHYVHV